MRPPPQPSRPSAAPGPRTAARGRPADVLAMLQRTAGNRSTGRLLQRRAGPALAGLSLGRNRAGNEVRVRREIGTLGGYEDRLQAVAMARVANAEHAAVGLGAGGRWHALELTGDFHGATYAPPAAGAALSQVHGLPPAGAIGGQRDRVAKLKAHSGTVAKDLSDATRDLYALILGVEGAEVLVNTSSSGRRAGKVNVNTGWRGDPRAPAGAHGRESRRDEGFQPGAPTAFELNVEVMDTPARASTVLFHEVSHLKDYELAQRWVTAYEKEGGVFVGGPGITYFESWLKTRTSPADAQLVGDIALGAQATTEARAYVRTFIATFDAGNRAEAAASLVAYAKGLANRTIGAPTQPASNAVIKELLGELTAYRRRLDRTGQAAFKAAIVAADKAHPGSWLRTAR